jgi:hypothetical protein
VIAVVVLVVLVVALVLRRVRRRRAERSMSADVMSEVLGTAGVYRGRRWNVSDRPWL